MRRWITLISALFLVLVTAATVLPASVAAEEVQFYVAKSIQPADAMFVREGIRLGQDYVHDQMGVDVEHATIVNAVPAEPRDGSTVVGISTSHAVIVYTGASGWVDTAPFDRVHVVVHEYMHVVQEELAGDRGHGAPLWIDEGSAEYVGYQAVIDAGLVSASDVDSFQTTAVLFGPDLPPLQTVEDPGAYQSEPANIYGLAYLAIEQLVNGHPDTIADYYRKLGDGVNWRAAFQSAFKINPSAFYDEFETSRAQLQAPFDPPIAFGAAGAVDAPAAVSISAIPESIERGSQLLVVAGSDAGASCELKVLTRSGRELLDQPTFADPTGRLFWLWSVPKDSQGAAVTASVSCGGEPVSSSLRIT